MNHAAADPTKKTSITSLLNPEASEDAFANQQLPNLTASSNHQPQPQPHGHSGHLSSSPFVGNASFNLRAASWDASDDGNRRKGGDNGVRHYHHHNIGSTDMHSEHGSTRTGRGREDGNGYPMEGPVWHPSQTATYAAPATAPMYSDERTALSGDYQSHSYTSQGYTGNSSSDVSQSWQSAERASVRLAARGTSQESRYTEGSYYQTSSSLYNASVYPQQQAAQSQQQPAQSQQQPRLVQPPPNKRPSPEEEEAPPKSKRPKTTKGTGPSKRGYNAKKRSEAAQIAAQNAKLMPSVSYTAGKGKEKANESGMQLLSAVNQPNSDEALHPELQFARCMSNRYKTDQFPRCVSCTRRWAGDTCRFQGIRFFLKNSRKDIVGISFIETQKADSPTMDFPTEWNVPLRPGHIQRTKRTIAQALLPTLRQELEHLRMPEIIFRPRESEVRATCDTCMTSIFSTSWMCRLCGREACAECYATVMDLTTDRPGADTAEILAAQARRERHAHSNPFFLACTRRNEHQTKDFSPMSRFCRKELGQAIEDMEKLLKNSAEPNVNGKTASETQSVAITNRSSVQPNGYAATQTAYTGSVPSVNLHPSLQNLPNVMPSRTLPPRNNNPNSCSSVPAAGLHPSTGITPCSTSLPYIPSNLSSVTLNTPGLPIRRFADSALTEESFPAIWALGEPLVVTDVLRKFDINWTPEYFMEKYGGQNCLIIECQTEVNKRITVGEFFEGFGKYEGRTECWKLKDWPPSTDFKSAFPELYDDFSKAVPVPSYVRRDGVLNIASHFPSNTVAPDLGPKMYNAMASSLSAGSKGSTRLHMDMADALNIMTYAAPCPDGSPGCAVWDLFRAEDSDKLRAFLHGRFAPRNNRANGPAANGGSVPSNGAGNAAANGTGANTNANAKLTASQVHDWAADPIHGQQFYLDEVLRKELHEMYGVKSYRVYQRPGEAVFIPAGCAHQVANLSDSIKVAIDFVSPENVERCEKLTKEFREQNQRKVWKEDVLQLRTMMWFAWLSCCQQEGGGDDGGSN